MTEFETPHGPARVHLRLVDRPVGGLVLGHGAGGGVETPDLGAAAGAANAVGFSVALVEQPYRVAGRRNQPPAAQLDTSWQAVVTELGGGVLAGVPVVVGGRSAGARVACRTAASAGAVGVVCLAFPLHPTGKGDDPTKSRLGELEAVRVPVLVLQGERDPFGMPPPGPSRTVVAVPGSHSLRSTSAVEAAVGEWLARLVKQG